MAILARDDAARWGVDEVEDTPKAEKSEKSEKKPVNRRHDSTVPFPGSHDSGGMPSMMGSSNTMDPVWQRLWLRCQQHDWQSLARALGLKDMGRMLAQIQSITSRGKRCIVVLKLVTENATTVPMAQNVDAALLGVFIGETSVVASSRTIDEVGRAKFLGSVVLNASLAK